MANDQNKELMDKIVTLSRNRGFIFPGSEIYGGLQNSWDYGPLGTLLLRNIRDSWWKFFVESRPDMVGLESTVIMNTKIWEASGHLENFTDPLVEDKVTHVRYRADHILEDKGVDPSGMSLEEIGPEIKEREIKSPEGNQLPEPRQFNLISRLTSDQSKKRDPRLTCALSWLRGCLLIFRKYSALPGSACPSA